MNKKELVYQMSERSGLTLKDTELVFDAMIETIHDNVTKTDIKIPFLGTFTVQKRASRVGRNPMTGEAIQISAKRQPRFKVSSTLKRIVNS